MFTRERQCYEPPPEPSGRAIRTWLPHIAVAAGCLFLALGAFALPQILIWWLQ